MTKPLVLKALGVSVALLGITAGIVYFALTPAPAKTLLTGGAIAAPSVSVTPSASPSPVVSVAPSEPPGQVHAPVSTTKAPPPKPTNVVISDVSFTCEGMGPYGNKVKLTGKVAVPSPMAITIRTDMEMYPGGIRASRFLPSVNGSETFSLEGAVVPMVITWSVEAGQPATWSQTMQQKNPC